MNDASDLAASPRHDLRWSSTPDEIEGGPSAERPRRPEIERPERIDDEPFDRLAGITAPFGASERLADESEAEIAVERRKAFGRDRPDRVGAAAIGDPLERGRRIDLAAADQRLVERKVRLEPGAMREEELEWAVFARGPSTLLEHGAEAVGPGEPRAPGEGERRHRLRQAREIEDRVELELPVGARPTCSKLPPAPGAHGPPDGGIARDAARDEGPRDRLRIGGATRTIDLSRGEDWGLLHGGYFTDRLFRR